jgi:UDPglucose 6-dehydrogenase
MHIAVIGTGHVGLVTSAGLADFGNDVVCVASDDAEVERLEAGDLGLYEPGLDALVEHNRDSGRIRFSADVAAAVERADVVMIVLSAPQLFDMAGPKSTARPGGQPELGDLFAVVDRVAKAIREGTVVVNRTTVPVGTTERIKVRISAHTSVAFSVVVNPAFLKEGDAVNDFMKPDRVLVGSDDPRAAEVLRRLYAPFVRTGDRIMTVDLRSAELSKYAASALLASRISFVNELALLADEVGADMEVVRRVLGADTRIGSKYLFVGPGFGGSHFQSDILMLLQTAREVGKELTLVRAAHEVNQRQKRVLAAKLARGLGDDLEHKRVGVWGLAYKPRTDDIGEAPAMELIDGLLGRGCAVTVHDPRAMDRTRAVYGDRISYAETMYDALDGAHALVLVTEWHEYRRPDFRRMLGLMAGRLVVDGRNVWDPHELRELGFHYVGIGRPQGHSLKLTPLPPRVG